MKLIHVSGEDDYSVIDFNRLHISHKEAYDKAFHSESGIWEFKPNGWVVAHDFPKLKVNKEFISMIKDILGDVDKMKAEDFFIVEE